MSDVLAELRALQAHDLPDPRRPHAGLRLRQRAGRGRRGRAARRSRRTPRRNGLDPTAFPSLLRMENDLVGLAGRLLDAPDDGRRLGDLRRHRVDPARRAGRPRRATRTSPRRSMVLPTTAHAAFHKAAHYFGVAAGAGRRSAPDFRADPAAMAAAIDDRTVLVVGSARRRTPTASSTRSPRSPRPPPSAASAATSTPASAAGCCRTPRGSAATCRRGRSRSTGVTSISRRPAQVRLHAQGRLGAAAPRPPALRRPQFFASAALARLHDAQPDDAVDEVGRPARRRRGRSCSTIGDDGYLDADRAGARRDATGCVAGHRRHPGAARASRRPTRRWSRSATDELVRRLHDHRRDDRARLVRPAAAVLRAAARPTLHLTLSAATAPHVEEFLAVLGDAVAAAVAAGPVRGRPGGRRRRARPRPGGARPTTTSTGCSPRPACSATGRARAARADGRGQRAARPRRTGAARGAAGRRSSTGCPGPTPRPA